MESQDDRQGKHMVKGVIDGAADIRDTGSDGESGIQEERRGVQN